MPEYSPDQLSKEERKMYDMMAPEDRKQFDDENRRMVEDYNDPQKRAAMFAEMDQLANQVEREEPMRFHDEPVKRRGFWAEDETDEFTLVEDSDEVFGDDEMTSMAHAEVEMHREVRDYMRIAAWDMPHLSSRALLYPGLGFPPMLIQAIQNLQNRSLSLRKPTSSASATPPTWVNSTRPSPKSSWKSQPTT